jgi:hypothetical protein
VGQAETEWKYIGVSGKRIRCFTHALFYVRVDFLEVGHSSLFH